MDTSDLIMSYSEDDFAAAIRSLLPKGQYWQESENIELTQTINAMAIDFKMTHDDIELSLLTNFKTELFGWKISDYEALLVQSGSSGSVYDDRAQPNLIFVALSPNERSENARIEFEKMRLPHTEIQWIYNTSIDVQTQGASARYIRNFHSHKVVS
ncbi:hypothetical protein L4C39_03640 [Vibrio clamense]|uniref:hypothetical protein n=1 Tax=Vibrio clamense TaxID=2910254 RepID=UPI003D25EC66